MSIKIGIMGKAGRSKDLPELLIKNARIIGEEVVKRGCILVTGSCMGVANIAAKVASEEKGGKPKKIRVDPFFLSTNHLLLPFTNFSNLVWNCIGCRDDTFLGFIMQ